MLPRPCLPGCVAGGFQSPAAVNVKHLLRAMQAARAAYRRLLDGYCAALRSRPWTTQSLSSAALWRLGDVAALRLEQFDVQHPHTTDTRRAAMVTLYGGLFIGPLGHAWLLQLDRLTRRFCPGGGVRAIGAKIALDTVLFGPVHVGSWLGLMGLLSGESRERISRQLEDKFMPTLIAESLVWPAIQWVNFSRVPLQHQLMVVNVASLADCTFLSWVKHQQSLGYGSWLGHLEGGPFGP